MKMARLSAAVVAGSICLLLAAAKTDAATLTAPASPAAGAAQPPVISPVAEKADADAKTSKSADFPVPGFGSEAAPTVTRKIGSVTTPDFIRVNSGERIDCGGGTITYSGKGGLLLEDVHDVVVQNCRFQSTLTQIPTQIGGKKVERTVSTCRRELLPLDTFGCGVGVFIKGQSYNIAIIHNSFAHCGEKCAGAWTEGLSRMPNGKVPTPDRITFAYNDFSDSYFGIAVGVSAAVEDSDMAENERVTFAFNRCDHVFRRCARFASGAQGDETNNVIRHWVWTGSDCGPRRGFGPSTTGGARVLLRANVIDADGSCPQAIDVSSYRNQNSPGEGRGIGWLKIDSAWPNLLLNGARDQDNQPETVALTVPEYKVLPAREVEAFVNANVGPKP